MSQPILIADDNESIIDIISMYLKSEGYAALTARDGDEAISIFNKYKPVLILLDIMMPKKDGLTVCREIRQNSNVPIILITAKGEDGDKIMGLDFGADDYIVKPFSPGEVMARIRALLRRIKVSDDEKKRIIKIHDLEIDISAYQVQKNGSILKLTKKEIEILWLLAGNPSKVFSREVLLDNIWGVDYFGDFRTVDTHIKRLRAKLKISEDSKWDIITIWKVGYKFEVKDVQK